MPIRIPDRLPSRDTLIREGVMVMDETHAVRQDIRPLQIGLLNLMPDKIRTETQLARLIGATPLQVELTLVRMGGHRAKTTPEEHLISFYQTWEEVRHRRFDGFVVTGAPVETLDFEDVTYWRELTEIFDWMPGAVHAGLFVCWGAMAALHHYHGVPKHALPAKAFGVFRHRNRAPASPYLTGFSDEFAIPVSRWTEIRAEDVDVAPGLEIMIDSGTTGPCLIGETAANRLYMLNHIEYDSQSLAEEYRRDLAAGVPVAVPHGYFPHDDPGEVPRNRWRAHAFLLFSNWINQTYQTTPFDLSAIGRTAFEP
jgi:homoserine O-succinyltransferase